MAKRLASRVLFSLVIMLCLSFFVFLLSNSIDGNAVDVLMANNPDMSQESYDALVHAYGLDQPILVRYWNWLTAFLSGDMGTSTAQNRPVVTLIAQRIGPTLILSFSSLLISLLISIPFGVMSAYKPYSIWDGVASGISFIGSSVPGFVLCIVGIYVFSVKLGWTPTSGMYSANSEHTLGNLLWHLTLPMLLMGIASCGGLIKQTRSAVLEVMNEDYIKTARSKGLGEFKVITGHALRNAMIPIITQLSLSVPVLVGGSVVYEKIFSWPGMGTLIITSITSRDYDPIMACALLICAVVLVMNILLDFVYVLVDPRLEGKK